MKSLLSLWLRIISGKEKNVAAGSIKDFGDKKIKGS